jgi:hypothetical protein
MLSVELKHGPGPQAVGQFREGRRENMPGAMGHSRLGALVWEKNCPRSVGGVVLAEGDRGRVWVARSDGLLLAAVRSSSAL